jgi:MFS family permease
MGRSVSTYARKPELISGVYTGAQVLILLIGHWPIDKFGRKKMLILTQVFMFIACLIEMFATNWTHWVAAKILNVNALYRTQLIL